MKFNNMEVVSVDLVQMSQKFRFDKLDFVEDFGI